MVRKLSTRQQIQKEARKKERIYRRDFANSSPAVVGLTKSDGIHYAPHGIRINAVCPGFVETPLLLDAPESDKTVAFLYDNIPVRRLVTPDEVADGVVFLASPMSSAMHASTLSLDLGVHASS